MEHEVYYLVSAAMIHGPLIRLSLQRLAAYDLLSQLALSVKPIIVGSAIT